MDEYIGRRVEFKINHITSEKGVIVALDEFKDLITVVDDAGKRWIGSEDHIESL